MAEEEAPEGMMWQDVKSFDENGNEVFKRELVPMMMCGGPTKERDANDEVKKMVIDLKDEVEQKRNTKYTVFDAVKFVTQVVSGVLYKIKVKVGENEYLHLNVLKKGDKKNLSVKEGTFTLEDKL